MSGVFLVLLYVQSKLFRWVSTGVFLISDGWVIRALFYSYRVFVNCFCLTGISCPTFFVQIILASLFIFLLSYQGDIFLNMKTKSSTAYKNTLQLWVLLRTTAKKPEREWTAIHYILQRLFPTPFFYNLQEIFCNRKDKRHK